MRSKKLTCLTVLTLLAVLSVPIQLAAGTFRVLHHFGPPPDGGHPFSGLTRDAAGNLYGTTALGGTFNAGTIFKLSEKGKESVLYSFTGGTDGAYPQQGQLTLDSAGNIYGTAGAGGSGFGVVFQLDRVGKLHVLYTFSGGADGGSPHAGVVRDAKGNLYGTTQSGGGHSCGGFGCGLVFKLDPAGKEAVLHSFTGGADGVQPFGNLVLDAKGNLYGTTYSGGGSSNCPGGCGVVFKVAKSGKEHVLHTFTGLDGGGSTAGLVRDQAGNLYGTTSGGGASRQGVVFKVDPTGKESVLYSFAGGTDGAAPIATVVLDSAGNLYGTTDSGGSGCFFGCGVVFKLAENGHETILHRFSGADGAQPLDLLLDPAGNLYGTTLEGGISGCTIVFTPDCGVVFKLAAPQDSSLSANPGLNPSSHSITGTPTTAGTSKVIVAVADSESPAAHVSANYASVTAPGRLKISSGAPPNGTFGVVYGPSSIEYLKCFWSPYRGWHLVCNPCSSPSACTSLPPCSGNIYISPCRGTKQVFLGFPLAAIGGLPPYTWALTSSSSPPPGLNLTTSGLIAGTPTTPGTYNITITVSDSASPATQAIAHYKIVIAPPPPPVINAVRLLPIGTLGSPYVGFTFTASSRAPSLTWSETGALPQGMSLSPDGALSGKPSEARTFPITVMVQDSFGHDATPVSLKLQVLTQGFLPTGSMETSRASHTATLLNTGKVLIAGGSPIGYIQVVASAELFDPISGTFSSTGGMGTARVNHTATLLADGRVLVTGGRDTTDNPVSTAEIFDPVKGTFSPTDSMETTRLYNTATLLKTGKVLVAGGLDTAGTFLATAELFDPRTGLFTPTGNMVTPRAGHTATLLSDGKVLVAGGDTTTAEIFDPATGTFTPTGSLKAARVNHTATLLKTGEVLVTGGQDNGSNTLASAELFDPAVGTFTPTGSMETVRVNHTAVLLNDGTVLVGGGNDSSTGLSFSSAELFHPASGRFTPTADMTAERSWHTATFLNNGKVLVTGGQNTVTGGQSSEATLATAELYQ